MNRLLHEKKRVAARLLFALLALPIATNAEVDACFVPVHTSEKLSIKLFDRKTCNEAPFDGNGFMILSEYGGGEITRVLWGLAYMDADDTYFEIVDFDRDSINEVVTLFSTDNTLWGYVHSFQIDSTGDIGINSIAIPDSLANKIDFYGKVEVLQGPVCRIYGDPTEPEQVIDIFYSADTDSIVIESKK